MSRAGGAAARVVVTALAGAMTGGIAVLAGTGAADAAVLGGATATVSAAWLLAPRPERLTGWPASPATGSTSAGSHDVRVLADTMSRVRQDVAARSVVARRAAAALGEPPPGPGPTRRAVDQILLRVRTAADAAPAVPARRRRP